MKRSRTVTLTEDVVETERLIEIRISVAINSTTLEPTWPTINAIAGVAAANIVSLGHRVAGIQLEDMGEHGWIEQTESEVKP